MQTKSYEAVDIANTCKYGVNIPEWSAVIFAIRTGACRMFNHTSPTIQEFRPINNISTLPVPSLHPTLPKKNTQTTRPIPPNWKKNRSNINLAVKVFTHPHSSFLNSYFPHTWSETAWIDSTPMVFQPTFQSWTLRFLRSKRVSPGTLASKAFTSFSFFRNSWIFNSTSLRGGRRFRKMSKRIPTRGW